MCAETTTTTTTPLRGIEKPTMAISTQDGKFTVAEYIANVASGSTTNNVISIVYQEDLGAPAGKILYSDCNDRVYITTRDKIYTYSVDNYVSNSEVNRIGSFDNTDWNVADFYQKNDKSLWSVQSYNDRVVKMDSDTLSIISQYDNIDAPFKVRYSEYHGLYFIAGSHALWTINDSSNTASRVYGVSNYSIKDMDVSEDGSICLLLDGDTDGYIRILGKDLYSFVVNEKVSNENLRYCKYCNFGRFYILSELDTITSTYSAFHYLFDIALNKIRFDNVEVTTTTTTSIPTTTKAVQLQSPIGGEQVEIGKTYNIKWVSSKSYSDVVKIDLYKQDVFYSSIVESTQNSGVYGWNVTNDIESDINYKVKITWSSNSSDANNYDISNSYFSIVSNPTTTTTTTTDPKITQSAISIDYSGILDQIVILLGSGAIMTFNLTTLEAKGLAYVGIINPSTMASNDIIIQGIDRQIKVRVFVGSEPNLSDKWDSGEVTTSLTSMYYGGGGNLEPGKKYYVHIQTCSQLNGWGAVQIKEFMVPK